MSSRTDDSVFSDEAYKDEDTLRELYVEKRLSQAEIGEKFGVTGSAIGYYIRKFDIQTTQVSDERLTNEGWLYEQYWNLGKNQEEIADICDVTVSAVGYWMEKHEIPVRDRPRGPAHYLTEETGYEYWGPTVNGSREWVPVHRLVAVAQYGIEDVSEGKIVHHRNNIPWDNRPENLEPIEWGEHTKLHKNKKHEGEPWKDPSVLYKEYINKKQTTKEVAEQLDASQSTIRKYLHKFEIPVRNTGESP